MAKHTADCECKIKDAPIPEPHKVLGVEGVMIGTEACPICFENFPVYVGVKVSVDHGVLLAISGNHLHSGIVDTSIPLPARAIRIDDVEDFVALVTKIKEGFGELARLVEEQTTVHDKIMEKLGMDDVRK